MKSTIVLAISFWASITLAHNEKQFRFTDYDAVQIEELKAFAGNYTGNGDSMEVVFAEVPEETPDLFGPQTFNFYGIYTDAHGNSYGFDLETLIIDGDKYVFSSAEQDCDDPGCVTHEGSVELNKKNGANVFISVSVDAEDLSPVYEESALEGEELEELLNQGCQDLYGKDAYLIEAIDDYKSSVYCGYGIKSSLKKSSFSLR